VAILRKAVVAILRKAVVVAILRKAAVARAGASPLASRQ
jgi:hypothetical protein